MLIEHFGDNPMDNAFKDYLMKVADYIDMEYGPDSEFFELTIDEKYAIKKMLEAHFSMQNSINNGASDVIAYIRDNRAWMKENIK